MVLIVPPSHALAGQAEVDKDELQALEFVALHRSSTVAAIMDTLEAHGISLQALRVGMVGAA